MLQLDKSSFIFSLSAFEHNHFVDLFTGSLNIFRCLIFCLYLNRMERLMDYRLLDRLYSDTNLDMDFFADPTYNYSNLSIEYLGHAAGN